MASSFATMSSIGYFTSSSSHTMDKKFLGSSRRLSSFASISANSFEGRKQSMVLQKRCSSKVRAMAKELYFNKDGSAIKKLQVSLQLITCQFDFSLK